MKPEKPSPDFPLFSHACGKWAKKINGKIRYFGRWDDPQAALAEYEVFLGKAKAESPPMLTVERGLNAFLHSKRDAMQAGKIEERTYSEYQRTCSRLAGFLGKSRDIMSLKPADFAAFQADRSKTMNLVSVGNEVTRVRTAFKWMHDSGILVRRIRFGPDFRKPSRRAVRKHRKERGKQLFEPGEIRLLLDESGIHLRAMILLGINAAYGPHDCAMLPISAVDLKKGWSDFARPKTEIDRLCPLWPETAEALRTSLSRRPEPTQEATKRFFVQYSGQPYHNEGGDMSKYFTAVRRRVVPEGGFYWLRKTFATVAGATGDQIAVNAIMGHADDSMAAVYRQEIQQERLKRVTDHVRSWLFD
ncbi:MAG: tyrosine-type recombinase/integrase [Planctomycetota bacterium]